MKDLYNSVIEEDFGEKTVVIGTPVCIYCKLRSEVKITKGQYDQLQHLQLEEISIDEADQLTKELVNLITGGTHPECMDGMKQ